MARDHHVAAHASGLVAVAANAGALAGRVRVQARGVGRACHGVNALDAGVHVLHYLVHAHQYVYFARAMQQAGKAVGVAVDVDQLAFSCDGVGAHEEAVAGQLLQNDRSIKEPSRWMTLLSSVYLIDRASATVSASMLPTELVSGTSFPFINDRHIISESFLSIHFHTF